MFRLPSAYLSRVSDEASGSMVLKGEFMIFFLLFGAADGAAGMCGSKPGR
jgi:hypothetical protein